MDDLKCNQCGWQGQYEDQIYVDICNEPGCCTQPTCPECGSSWPVPMDDVIREG